MRSILLATLLVLMLFNPIYSAQLSSFMEKHTKATGDLQTHAFAGDALLEYIPITRKDTANRLYSRGMTLPFEMKVFIDDRYAYYDYTLMKDFISDMENLFGFTVVSADRDGISYYNFSYISQYDFFILPNPQYGNLTMEEQAAVRSFINRTRGFAIITGYSNYSDRLNNHTLNNITEPFGVKFLWGQTTDPTDNDGADYYPRVHVWTNTTAAKLVSGNGTYVVEMGSSTSLNITRSYLNGTWEYIYVMGVGDDDTEFNSEPCDGNVIYVAGIENPVNGCALITSGSGFFDYRYGYNDVNSKDFLLDSIRAAMNRDLAIISYDIPTGILTTGEIVYINISVKNYKNVATNDVYVGVEFYGALQLLNDSNSYYVGTMNSGDIVNVTFAFKVVGTSNVVMELKTWSNDDRSIFGYQIRGSFSTIGLEVHAYFSNNYIVLQNFNDTVLYVNVTNPTSDVNATNVSITVTPHSYYGNITTTNASWSYTIPLLENGTSKIVKWFVEAADFISGENVIFTIDVSSDNVGYATDKANLFVASEKLVIFDNYHTSYYNASKMFTLIDMANYIYNYNVYILNSTLDANILGNTSLLIIPDIEENFTAEELVAIGNYLNSGGHLFIMGACHVNPAPFFPDWQQASYNNITGRFGIVWNMGEAKDDVNYVFGRNWRINLTRGAFGMGFIAKNITFDISYALYLGGTYLNVSSYAEVIIHGNPGSTYAVDPDNNNVGLGAESINLVAGFYNESSGTKIIATGSSKMFYDGWPYPLNYENGNLLRKILLWFRYYPDTSPPTVTITSPINGSYIPITTLINWTGVDDASVYSYRLYINGSLYARYPWYIDYANITLPGEGDWEITLLASDWAGNNATTTIIVHVDETSPTVDIISPSNDSWFNTPTINIEWDYMEENFDHTEIIVNGTSIQNITDPTVTSLTIDLDEGYWVIEVVVEDVVGNRGEDFVCIYVDLTPPSIVIVSPENDSWVSNLTVVWNVSDNYAIEKLEVYINGTLNQTISGIASNVTLYLSDGSYIIEIVAYDKAGNSDSDYVVVNIDSTPPEVAILYPENGSVLGTETINVTWSYVETEFNRTEIYLNGTRLVVITDPTVTSYSITNLTEGYWVIKVAVYDSIGNVGRAEIIIYVDLTPPSITILSPANDSWLNMPQITVVWTVTDEYGVESIKVYVNGHLNTSLTGDATNVTLTLKDGLFIINISVYDYAGNSATDTIYIHIDTVPPTVEITSPANGSTYSVGEDITITWNASDNYMLKSVKLYINGELKYETTGSGSYMFKPEEPGDYVISVVTMDYAGNTDASVVTIVVTTTTTTAAGVQNWVYATIGLGVAAVIITTILVLLRKKKPVEE